MLCRKPAIQHVCFLSSFNTGREKEWTPCAKLTKWELSFASWTCCTCGSATTFVSWSEVMSRLLLGSSGRSLCHQGSFGGHRETNGRDLRTGGNQRFQRFNMEEHHQRTNVTLRPHKAKKLQTNRQKNYYFSSKYDFFKLVENNLRSIYTEIIIYKWNTLIMRCC